MSRDIVSSPLTETPKEITKLQTVATGFREEDALSDNREPLSEAEVQKLKDDAKELRERNQKLNEIGIALSAERNLSSLLERILTEARRFTHADAGTIYMLRDDGMLHFEVMHNDTFHTYLGGASGNPIPDSLKPVQPDTHHVSGYVALKRETVNIPDVYEAEGFDFSGTRAYDERSGYRSRSMLVVPMQNREGEVVGVLQLINAQTPDQTQVIPFTDEVVSLIQSMASQAAVALINAQLIQDLRGLFEALMSVMAKAVDVKDPTTAGHIDRVTALSVALARSVNEATEGPLVDIHFSDDELEELRIAGRLHDIGKLTTPEQIMNKGRKLETLFDRAELLKERFRGIMALRRAEGLEEKIVLMESGASYEELAASYRRLESDLKLLKEEMDFLLGCNEPDEFMEDAKLERLKKIAQKTYEDNDGNVHPYLTEDELENLSIRRGSFTWANLQVMRDHVAVTMDLLELVPFTRKWHNVPLYAGQHHELLDGTGYPKHLTGDQLPLQSRIMTICDIFDALSAKDRPYKKAFKLEMCIDKLKNEMRDKLDPNLVDIFIKNRLWEKVGLHTTATDSES
jgi:HD-GYP domain-containing protein (c-di-GMP phosphodiesterase class II)